MRPRRVISRQITHPAPSRHLAGDRALAVLAPRLTARDRWLIRLLWDHRVLTTHQITRLAYRAGSTARHRLLTLTRLGVLERFRPLLAAGSAPVHYVIGEAGARVLAAERGISLAELGYRRDRALAIAYSPRLTHTVGVNELFTSLSAAAHTNHAARLITWWPERRCAETWGDHVRPDAYGRWHEHGRDVDFFLEYDLGTEPLPRVAGKLAGYTDLATATGVDTPVLIWTTTPARETHLQRHLHDPPVPVATATPHAAPSTDSGWDLAGPAWLPTDSRGQRVRLIDLAGDHDPAASFPVASAGEGPLR